MRWTRRPLPGHRTAPGRRFWPAWRVRGVPGGRPPGLAFSVTRPDDSLDERDPQRPVRLLQAERDALLPILARTPEAAFDRPTACPDWSVRDVLSHCSAALTRTATGRLHAFTPELNEIDVAERRAWPLS